MFFALPDGSGLLYTLTGTADPPKPAGNIPLEVPCKMPYTEVLQVTNWLRKPQRYAGLLRDVYIKPMGMSSFVQCLCEMTVRSD